MHFNVILFYKKNEKNARLSLYGFYVRGLLCDIMKKTKSRLIKNVYSNLKIFSMYGLLLEIQQYKARIKSNDKLLRYREKIPIFCTYRPSPQ
jgi:hypothetical protein